jgi:hypothetical protein
MPWMTERCKVEDPFVQLHNEIVEFYNILGPTKDSEQKRKKLFLKVSKHIKS